MKIMVTGGAGYIGSIMVAMLQREGHEVIVLDNLASGHRPAVRGAPLDEIDVEDLEAVVDSFKGFKPEACMHFAACSLVDESVEEPLKYLKTNLGGGLNLLEGMVRSGCRLLVFSSTAAVYGSPGEIPITEDSPRNPVNPYGQSKLLFEQALEDVTGAGFLKYASLRYFNAAGADLENDLGEDHDPETHLIPRVVSTALGGRPEATIFGTDYPTPDGTCVRDYIHVTDLCRAHLLALDHLLRGGGSGAFNLGNAMGFSVREVIQSVMRVSGIEFRIVEADRREGDPPVLVASNDKAGSILGWKPRIHDLDEIVRSSWEWHRNHIGGYGNRGTPPCPDSGR